MASSSSRINSSDFYDKLLLNIKKKWRKSSKIVGIIVKNAA